MKGIVMMAKDMKVAVMTDIKKIEFIRRDIPTCGPDEVLVKLEYVGICGSDVHYFEHGRIGDFVVEPPFVLGHEASGTVVALGQEVTHLAVGDRVALEPGKTCGECEFCRGGKYNLCPDVIFFATPPVDGVFSEYVAHEAKLCFKLPDEVSSLEGAMIEPLAVGLHAAKQGDAEPGQTAIVFGAGCIGLCSMLALKAYGVSKVYIADIFESRLEKAKALGADGVINTKLTDISTLGVDFDLAIDTSGVSAVVNSAIHSLKKGGTIVLVGYSATGESTLETSVALNKELTFKTVFRYRHIYPMAIESVACGNIKLNDLVTDTFEFDDLQRAMEECIEKKETIIKAAVKI